MTVRVHCLSFVPPLLKGNPTFIKGRGLCDYCGCKAFIVHSGEDMLDVGDGRAVSTSHAGVLMSLLKVWVREMERVNTVKTGTLDTRSILSELPEDITNTILGYSVELFLVNNLA